MCHLNRMFEHCGPSVAKVFDIHSHKFDRDLANKNEGISTKRYVAWRLKSRTAVAMELLTISTFLILFRSLSFTCYEFSVLFSLIFCIIHASVVYKMYVACKAKFVLWLHLLFCSRNIIIQQTHSFEHWRHIHSTKQSAYMFCD